jgi:aspartate/glutamate/glutamine transport system substrate-binding protein
VYKTIIRFSVFMLAALLMVACVGTTTAARAKEGTLLRKIQDRGTLIIGVKYDQPTFGYLNPKTNALEGFDIDLSREIAAYILGDPNKVQYKEAVVKDHVPFLKDGTVDIVVATSVIIEDRLKDIDYSIVYFMAAGRLLVLPDSPIRSIADLEGKKVGAVKGSSTAASLSKQVQTNIILVDSVGDLLPPLLNHSVDAASATDTALYGLILTNPSQNLRIVGSSFVSQPYGVGVAKGNPELLDAVNTVIKNMKSSGKWQTYWKQEIGAKLNLSTVADPPSDDWRN